jgi:uncharacterized protein (TIGR02099 family)
MEATGDKTLDLELAIPLNRRLKHIPINVQGNIAFAGNDLTLPSGNLTLNQIRGDLNFTRSGLEAKDLRLVFRGQPARLNIGKPSKDRGGIRFRMHGTFSVEELLGKSGAVLQPYLPGRSRWDIVLTAPPKQPGIRLPYDLTLSSDLHGTEVRLPPPMGKAANQKRTLSATTQLGKSDDLVLDLSYNVHTRALLELTDYRTKPNFKRGELRINTGSPQLPEHLGLNVAAHLARFEPTALLTAAPSSSPPSWLNTVQARFDELALGNHTFPDVGIDLKVREDAVTIGLSGKTLAGRLDLPMVRDSNTPVSVKLRRLTLPDAQPANNQVMESVDPRNLPPLHIAIDEFRLADKNLGKVRLSTRPRNQGLELQSLELTSPFYQINANGDWKVTATGQSSHLRATLYSGQPGNALKTLGHKAKLEGGETRVELDARWPAALVDFDARLLEGNLNLHIGKGHFPDIEPGIGRMIGLFSLDSLSRRLRLDFSDLFDEGLSFDRIQGNFSFHDGYAITRDLMLEAPSAQIAISGRTDLENHLYDQTVTVVPDVGLSLPIAGTLAGGPIVGAALLLAGRIFKPGIDEIGRYRYSVTGSWDNPIVKPIAATVQPNKKRGFTNQSSMP